MGGGGGGVGGGCRHGTRHHIYIYIHIYLCVFCQFDGHLAYPVMIKEIKDHHIRDY